MWIPSANSPADVIAVVTEMLRLPNNNHHNPSQSQSQSQGQGQEEVSGGRATAGDVAAVMVSFMGWLNDVSSGDSSGSGGSSSSSSSAGGGAIAGSTRKEDTTTTGQGLGIGEAKGPGLGLGLSLASTGKGVTISVREVLAWAAFVSQWVRLMGCEEDGVMDVSSTSNHPHQPLASSSSSSSSSSSISSPLSFATTVYAGVLHGAHMVVLDGLGIGLTAPRETIRALKQAVKH